MGCLLTTAYFSKRKIANLYIQTLCMIYPLLILFGASNTTKERATSFGIWWLIGFILILAIGMLVYVLIKKNPRKDAND